MNHSVQSPRGFQESPHIVCGMYVFQTVIVALVLIAGPLCSAGHFASIGATAEICAALPVTIAPPTTAAPNSRAFDPATFGAKQLLVVHYARTDQNYNGWNVWAWVVDQTGQQLEFKGADDYGPYVLHYQ